MCMMVLEGKLHLEKNYFTQFYISVYVLFSYTAYHNQDTVALVLLLLLYSERFAFL